MQFCPVCGGSPQIVSTVSCFIAKREDAAKKYDTLPVGERPPVSVLPGDVGVLHHGSPMSKLPGDQYLKTARDRAFKVFSSMREAFAVPAAA